VFVTRKVLLELVRIGPRQTVFTQIRSTFQFTDTTSRHSAVKARGLFLQKHNLVHNHYTKIPHAVLVSKALVYGMQALYSRMRRLGRREPAPHTDERTCAAFAARSSAGQRQLMKGRDAGYDDAV